LIEAFEALPPLPGLKKIYVAGGYEAEVAKEGSANGIPLHHTMVESLQELSGKLGIEDNFLS
jgi:LDH2 family malate/lactate/ureidoglycolate dehydrogenase